MITPEQVRSAIEGYVAGFNQGPSGKKAWLDWFSDNVETIDPVGTPPNIGKGAVGGFFDSVFSNFKTLDFKLRDLFICGNEAALEFTIIGHNAEGSVIFDGVDTFRMDESGKIASLKAYWEPGRVKPLP